MPAIDTADEARRLAVPGAVELADELRSLDEANGPGGSRRSGVLVGPPDGVGGPSEEMAGVGQVSVVLFTGLAFLVVSASASPVTSVVRLANTGASRSRVRQHWAGRHERSRAGPLPPVESGAGRPSALCVGPLPDRRDAHDARGVHLMICVRWISDLTTR